MEKLLKVLSSLLNGVVNWIVKHPKTATVVGVFVIGFLLGILI